MALLSIPVVERCPHSYVTQLLSLGLLGSVLVGCSNETLTERPPEAVSPAPPLVPEPSVVSVTVDVPKDEVLRLVKAQLPKSIHFAGPWTKYISGHRQKGNFSVNVPEIDWSVTGTARELRISAPFIVKAKASVSGSIGAVAGSKDIRANFTTAARVSLQINDQWCPRVAIAPEAVVWNDKHHPQIELLQNFWATKVARSEFEGEVTKAMQNVEKQVNDKIPCASLQANFKNLWKTHAMPLPGITSQPGFAAYITPQEMSLDLPTFTDKLLHTGLMLKAVTQVATSPPAQSPMPLPKPMLAPIKSGQAFLNFPMTIPYEVLESTAKEKLPKNFQYKIGGTNADVKISEVEIYPSNGKVAVGMNVDVDVPGKWFDVSGRVWLVGEPVLDVKNQTLALKSVSLARKLDNSVWQALSIAFDQSLTDEVMKAAQVDLKPHVTTLREKLAKQLADANSKMSGVKIGVDNVEVKLMRVTPAQDLIVVAQANGNLSVELDLMRLSAPKVATVPAPSSDAPKPLATTPTVLTDPAR